MSMFLAVVALFVAFGALWFTSEIARRVDLRNKTVLGAHTFSETDSLQHAERRIRELSLGLQAAEQKIQSLNMQSSELENEISVSDSLNAKPARPISTLDILRGAHRFYPSDSHNS
ncbi:hypothetical protein L2D14_10830 [Thalassospiraceae bacterium LMO-JJ14]|nr:hypothetical protein L2D14_10830 [Thalassospiraceae bacterium LMO-JJ14]